jgi:hypothetical protein
MSFQDTQFVQRTAANMATGLRQDPRVRDKLKGVPDPALQAKSAKTVVGGFFLAIGCLLLFGALAGIGAALALQWVEPSLLVLSFLFAVPALGVIFIILGAVSISGELKDTLGWFSLFVRGLVSIFRKLPNGAPPAAS